MYIRSEDMNCSVARTLEIMGDPWNFLVLRAPFFHVNRFDEIQRNLGIPRNTLAGRLKHLTAHGVLERHSYHHHPPRFDYRLTAKGLDLYPSILAMMRWGDRWLADDGGPPLLLNHKNCGQYFQPEMLCSRCGEKITARVVDYGDGPGAGNTARPLARRLRRSSTPEAYERGRACSVARTLKILGNRWSFLVLRETFFGVHRFDEMQRSLGIARNILTDRLINLVNNGVLARRKYQLRPERYEYCLTEKGVDLYPSILAMLRWGDRWLAGDGGPPLLLYHKNCGQHFQPEILCSGCGQEITARVVNYEDGPGATSSDHAVSRSCNIQ